ncbi:uncharacterized protein LOC115326004 [Ixodes scapularis]|uniref:uncharacterized protein LOC115326004 n=1 Tax=Ixodes scapularis TaxID=6945 RepID=UPI001C3901A4|nr:uncharacterized protein LOC115326004 [Ixodes scapularis]
MRGSKWSELTIQTALRARLACGSHGYNYVRENLVPFPSQRTLQSRIEKHKYLPGILEELFPALGEKAARMLPQERHAALLMDEMQITPGYDIDPASKQILGARTVKPPPLPPKRKRTPKAHAAQPGAASPEPEQIISECQEQTGTQSPQMEQVLAGCHVQPGTVSPQREQNLPDFSVQPGTVSPQREQNLPDLGVQPGAASAKEIPPPHATHALVFMLAGMASRWKQVVAYHFTGNSFDPKEVKDILFNIIKKCEGLQMVVDAVISDMGPCNQGIWRLCGVHASRSVPAAVSCRHPCAGDTNRQLFFLADAPHLLKNIRGHLVKGQEIVLPRDVVQKHGLPSNRVSLKHVEELVAIDSKHDMKLVPKLKHI